MLLASAEEQAAVAGILAEARSAGLDASKAVPAWLANLDLSAPMAAAFGAVAVDIRDGEAAGGGAGERVGGRVCMRGGRRAGVRALMRAH